MYYVRFLVISVFFIIPLCGSVWLTGGNNEFLTAACKGNEKHALWLIENNQADFSSVDSNGWNALHFAIKNNMQQIVDYLINKKSFDVNKPTKDFWYPVHIAALYGHVEILKKLKKRGALMHVGLANNRVDIYDNAFTLAARKNQKEALLFCLPLMPFAWNEERLPSFPKKVCYEMRAFLTRQILNIQEGKETEGLVLLLSRWLQKGRSVAYFEHLPLCKEAYESTLIINNFPDEMLVEPQKSALLVLQFIKFFFYIKSNRDKKFKVRDLIFSEKQLCQKLSIFPYCLDTAAEKYFFNNFKKAALKTCEYEKRPFLDLKICID